MKRVTIGLGRDDLQFMKLQLGLFTVRPSLDEANFLPGRRDHPPAGVLAKPDPVQTRHYEPPVKKVRLD
jgi:hypothetical protein